MIPQCLVLLAVLMMPAAAGPNSNKLIAVRGTVGKAFRIYEYNTSLNAMVLIQTSTISQTNQSEVNVTSLYISTNTTKQCFVGLSNGHIEMWTRSTEGIRFSYLKTLSDRSDVSAVYFLNATTTGNDTTLVSYSVGGLERDWTITPENISFHDQPPIGESNETVCQQFNTTYGPYFYYSNRLCKINCSEVPKANSTVPNSSSDCVCVAGYQWMLYSCEEIASLVEVPSTNQKWS